MISSGNILTELQNRANLDWFIGYPDLPLAASSCRTSLESEGMSQQLWQLTVSIFEELNQVKPKPQILLIEKHPLKFLAGFLAAVAAGCPVFLGNPLWQETEWQQVFQLVQPNLLLGNIPNAFHGKLSHRFLEMGFWLDNPKSFTTEEFQENKILSNLIMIPTGGSSGKIRFAIHTWETLSASVHGFYHYFEQKLINSYCILPLYHVSGLMQFMRSFLTGGKMIVIPFKDIKTQFDPTHFFISLVPTQLQRILQHQANWLAAFHTVLLGGAPAWNALLEEARRAKIPLALTYGMTETASQIVTLKPKAFLSQNSSCGQVLPHAKVTICSESGECLPANQIGIIKIESKSLMLGYYHPNFQPLSQLSEFQSDDLGFLDEQGYLHIVGRNSQKIITGGENVFPGEVEAAILATQLAQDVGVIGIPDAEWGQAVTAVYVPACPDCKPDAIKSAIASQLARYKHPKIWISVEYLPRNAQGKLNREALLFLALNGQD